MPFLKRIFILNAAVFAFFCVGHCFAANLECKTASLEIEAGYVSCARLAEAFQLHLDVDELVERTIVSKNGRFAAFAAGQKQCLLGTSLIHTTADAMRMEPTPRILTEIVSPLIEFLSEQQITAETFSEDGKTALRIALVAPEPVEKRAPTISEILYGVELPPRERIERPGESAEISAISDILQLAGAQTRDIVVVIDAGHGGPDTGGRARDGIFEKDVTLDLAKALANRLSARERFTPVLTRRDTGALSIKDRIALANRAANGKPADIFVSIHLSGYLDLTVRGFAVFTAGDSTDPVKVNPASYKRLVSKQFHNSRTMNTRFANKMKDSLRRQLGTPERTIDVIPAAVLQGLKMPAILVEPASVTNAQDAADLSVFDHRRKCIDAIEEGIVAFAEEFLLTE
ncbi:N-acetylmuramoyl-L-alanine amidase [Candidatus Hydrogenedentota bacterium]